MTNQNTDDKIKSQLNSEKVCYYLDQNLILCHAAR